MKPLRFILALVIVFFTWYLLLFAAVCLFIVDLVEDFKVRRTEIYVEAVVNAFEFVAGLNGRHRN